MPDIVPIWCREWDVDRTLLAGIRERGAEPVLYVEAHQLPAYDLRLFACRIGDGTVVRVNQEMDGDWGAFWQDWLPQAYASWFAATRAMLREENDVRLFWCPSIPRRAHEQRYWPGEADIVGFDRYVWKGAQAQPAGMAAGPVDQCNVIAPGVPVWWGEHGTLAGVVPKRAERLRNLELVEGVEAVVIMNMRALRPDGKFDDWTWTPSMERTFRTM